MPKNRIALVSLTLTASIVVMASQVALPNLLSQHLGKMTEAKSVRGTVNVQPLPGTPKKVTFVFSKPNFFRIEDEEGFVVGDGANVTKYVKATNSYTVVPVSEAVISESTGKSDTWVWAAFFNKDAFKGLAAAKAGGKRTVKGVKVTEVETSWDKPTPGQATIYFDEQGSPRGFNLKSDGNESLVIAEEVVVSDAEVAASEFAFVAPEGAKKVEALEAPKAGFAAVKAIFSKNCMPCHNAQNRKNGIDLSTYDAIVNNQQAVTPGDPDHSAVYRSVAGPRATMPKGGPKLSEAQTKVIYEWIANGAKED